MATITKDPDGGLEAFVADASLFVCHHWDRSRLRIAFVRNDTHVAQYLTREQTEALRDMLTQAMAEETP